MPDNPNLAMKGFDAEFLNLDHYIRVITDRIWEGGRIDDIKRYYSDPCIVETPSSVSTALQDVIDGTKGTLAMFPDRRLLAEDVIQSGDAEHGFLSSHRIISTMTHRGNGNGSFGVATNKRIQVRTVADCVCINNRIVHEWLVRDQAAIALQIGSTPRAIAQTWLNQRSGFNKPVAGAAPGGYVSHISKDSFARAYAEGLADFAFNCSAGHAVSNIAARKIYDDAVHHIGPGGTTYFGQDEVATFWTSLFSALHVQDFKIEHLALQTGNGRAHRVALRWRAQAVHKGDGRYGAPTNKPVEILGINHVEFYQGRVLREWVLIDDVALWMQILDVESKK